MEIVILSIACFILLLIAFLADRGRRAALQAHDATIQAFRDRAVIERRQWYERGYQQAMKDMKEEQATWN